jgi:hypothetical protein
VRPLLLQLLGVALFLFIPVVLFLFVRHPEPVGASLVAGIALMLGHRFLARPYFEKTRERKCAWCNRWLGEGAPESFEVDSGDGGVRFVACAGHAAPAKRYFAWIQRMKLPLRAGIGLPLILLLLALAATASGRLVPLRDATELFRFVVGLTVQLGALGPFLGRPTDAPPRAVFPLHNFSLLGVAAILWIFRLVGIWWIAAAGTYWFNRLGA